MEFISIGDIVKAMTEIGLRSGDTVNVHSRLHAVGAVNDAPVEGIPAAYLTAFREVIGETGTIVVPSTTTSFGRFGTPFVLEESPSELGVFSEYVRQSPGATRSLHPIDSLAALGPRAEELTNDHPRWNVGHGTTWDRMLGVGAKVVTIGVSPRESMSFMHQVEFMACVPYLYNKILQGEVSAGGRSVDGEFVMAVRYLNFEIAWDLTRLEGELEQMSAYSSSSLGGHAIWSVPMEAAFEAGMQGLKQDPYFLLKQHPTFVRGTIPFDGSTRARESSVPRYFLS